MSVDAIGRARELGAEHGREAARTWWDRLDPDWKGSPGSLATHIAHEGLPEPVMDAVFDRKYDDIVWLTREHIAAYQDAFRAAVRAEVERACEDASR